MCNGASPFHVLDTRLGQAEYDVIDAIHRYVPYSVNTDGIVPLKDILSNAPWYVWLRLAILERNLNVD